MREQAHDMLALRQASSLCQGHSEALRDALHDMAQRNLTCNEYEHLNKEELRLFDQFAYRYTRLQDDMGGAFDAGRPASVGRRNISYARSGPFYPAGAVGLAALRR